MHMVSLQTQEYRHLREQIGKNIHRIRSKRRLRLEKLAGKTGINARRLDSYELGCGEITLGELLRISRVFGVDICDLMFGDG